MQGFEIQVKYISDFFIGSPGRWYATDLCGELMTRFKLRNLDCGPDIEQWNETVRTGCVSNYIKQACFLVSCTRSLAYIRAQKSQTIGLPKDRI